jgi:hypothetical protein
LETNNNPIESATKPGLGLVLNLTRVNIIIIILKSQLRYVIGFFFFIYNTSTNSKSFSKLHKKYAGFTNIDGLVNSSASFFSK